MDSNLMQLNARRMTTRKFFCCSLFFLLIFLWFYVTIIEYKKNFHKKKKEPTFVSPDNALLSPKDKRVDRLKYFVHRNICLNNKNHRTVQICAYALVFRTKT